MAETAETTEITKTAPPAPTPTAARRRPRLGDLAPHLRVWLLAALLVPAVAAFLFAFVRGSFEFAFERRATMLGAMVVAAFCQSVGTVLFQTVTQNRLLTPSIMGFESVYTLMQTLTVFLFGGATLAATDGLPKLVVQTLLMVGFSTLLFRWLFGGRLGSLHVLLLVGVSLGLAFSSLSTFLQRLLSPSQYDVLSARLYGRLGTADAGHLPLALAVCAVIGFLVWRRRRRLDVLLLGRDAATGLGIAHKRELTQALIMISVLLALSTALVGPMTFFGFVVTVVAHQLAGTHRHAIVLPMAFVLGLLTLVSGQFAMEHVFYASGMLTVVIEFLGGAVFLACLLRKGTL
ncbi:iron chelate uptake ABC transporter family permease subunit [Streptomyces sp. BI20]|uniref:iron chelate uptake ABC transporter family permease subunit n=1 Tax=Streptomyces sp. BI20 TaxID=3403460 RepID=UPI003C755124